MKLLKRISLYSMACLFVFAGANHFLNPNFYLKMMPPYFPEPSLLVILSGLAEIIFGLLLVFSRTQKAAALGLIALLIAVFPANVYMYQQGSRQFSYSDLALLLRLPLQILLIAWVYFHFRTAPEKKLVNFSRGRP